MRRAKGDEEKIIMIQIMSARAVMSVVMNALALELERDGQLFSPGPFLSIPQILGVAQGFIKTLALCGDS